MRKIRIPLIILGLIGLDQLVKYYVVQHISLNQIKPLINHVISLTYLRNYGAAFSILQNQQWLFTIITLVVIGSAIYYLIKHSRESWWLITALILIISGGLGNFIDRVHLGYVVDMFHLDFIDFAVFNVADSYLTVGVIILMIYILREE